MDPSFLAKLKLKAIPSRPNRLFISLGGALAVFSICFLGFLPANSEEPVEKNVASEASSTPLAAVEEVQFNRDIRPILSKYCFTCHGPDEGERKADLRLDLEANAFEDLGGYHPIVAGKPEASEVFKRIASEDPKVQMPPPSTGKTLNPHQRELLRSWIAAGAKWQDHWSFVPPQRPPLPQPIPEWKPINEIDLFVQARIQDEHFTPSDEADKRTLIRRLYLDLTGLPPSEGEVRAFVESKKSDTYEYFVDYLLQTDQFGERMATFWLDLVRYSDSIGYHSDNPRQVWLYRDYVIRSFNENKPYDDFTMEQIAGDLFENATEEERVGSIYNRLLQTTQEGGSQPKEYAAKYIADRVRNVSSVWMAATMGCAECHDHKYDPFTTKDFYSMGAFFADIDELPVGLRVNSTLAGPKFEANLAQLRDEIQRLEKELTKSTPALERDQAAWETEIQKKLSENQRQDQPLVFDRTIPKAQLSTEWNYAEAEDAPKYRDAISRKQKAKELVQHYYENSETPITLGSQDSFYAYVYLDPQDPPASIMLQFNDGNWSHRAWWGERKIPYGLTKKSNAPNYRRMGDLPQTGEWVRLEINPADLGLPAGTHVSGMAFTQWGGTAYWSEAGVNSDGLGHLESLLNVFYTAPEKRTKKQLAQLAKYYRSISPSLEEIRVELSQRKMEISKLQERLPRTLLTTTKMPAMIRVLPRGNWMDDSGEVVNPRPPTFMASLQIQDRRPTRLDLAHWLVDRENPMTSRAMVNRLWKLYFGYGLARTLDDLGGQGEWPTHPKLLDWLAVEFMDSDWDVKKMVRMMVMSRAYRQSSKPSSELRAADPYNKLFARQTRFRIDAEYVRDNALSVSGLLDRRIGGPSVYPYQPADYWQHLNFPIRSWPGSQGDDLYRRGLYTHWQRTFLHPSLLAFDAPSREECTAERSRSNTPQQALVLLNDPTYVEAARVLATEMMDPSISDPNHCIQWAFQRVLQRDPSEEENSTLQNLYEKHLKEYQANPGDAEMLLKIGASKLPEGVDHITLAAWTSVARVILNLHESITRY